ncbi:MAG: PP2C family protein-serine/threonine phosphatase [Ignavibacteriales bacterium]|nr:PP2C family protein-serine/threonine phosphatase [Ignavibacteriales bacterium]
MLEPKIFYRKLDSLLTKIGSQKSGKDFLFSIVKEIENTFGKDLRISNGRIYEEEENNFVLISPVIETIEQTAKTIPGDSPAMRELLKSKTYIFDNPLLTIDNGINNQGEYRIPVAITIGNSEFSWIFVFELKSGWVREEIEFCFNAVRTMLNYRFLSEASQNEIEQAALIQKSLLPSIAPQFPRLSVAGLSKPAELVGGDLYDYFDFDQEQFGVCIGDASGHGLPAALLVRDVVTGLRMGLEKHMKMEYTFKKLNSVIYRSVYSTRFISLFYAEIEKDGNLLYVNAGHPSPLLFHGSEISELRSTGLLFGALPEIELTRGYSNLNTGDILLLYTDGIIERMNNIQEEYGVERLKEIVLTNLDKSPKEIIDAIFYSAEKFGNNKNWEDDATIVVVKRSDTI